MTNIRFFLLSLALSVSASFLPNELCAQGCSDAGFCTLNHLSISASPAADSVGYKSTLSIGVGVGLGDDGNVITTPTISYSGIVNKRISLDIKLTSAIISGKKGFNGNLSDLFLTSNFTVFQKHQIRLTVLPGLKVPLNYADATYRGAILPLSYQTSLGSIDAIAGFSFLSKYIDASTAIQWPFFQGNRNTFFATGHDTVDFSNTNHFEWKPDALLRVTGHYTLKNEKWKFSGSLLGIYHLGNDNYLDGTGIRRVLPHSYGLTLNAVAAIDYVIDRRQSIQLSAATPLVVRKIRPDGLTRSVVVAVEYRISF